jgi:hypothetical protein
MSRRGVGAAMQRSGLAAIALWVFTAGIFAWIFPNLSLGSVPNALTDVAIVLGGVLAAVGLPRAVEGIGTGPLRTGLVAIALFQFGQNLVSAFSLSATNAAPVFVVMLAAVALAVGAWRWQEDGWDLAALPWLMAGFAGFAFEPLYYNALGFAGGRFWGPYALGAWLVLAGAGLAAWTFRPHGAEPGIPAAPTSI